MVDKILEDKQRKELKKRKRSGSENPPGSPSFKKIAASKEEFLKKSHIDHLIKAKSIDGDFFENFLTLLDQRVRVDVQQPATAQQQSTTPGGAPVRAPTAKTSKHGATCNKKLPHSSLLCRVEPVRAPIAKRSGSCAVDHHQ